jgi:hypothetical protein
MVGIARPNTVFLSSTRIIRQIKKGPRGQGLGLNGAFVPLNDLWVETHSTPEAAMDEPKKEVFLDASQGVVLMG